MREVTTEGGEATRFTLEGERRPLWSIQWQSANVRFGSEGLFGGSMEQVRGTIFDDSNVASSFTADRADADKASGELTLSGNVVVTSEEQGTTLRSDKLVWASKGEELIKAVGGVSLKGDWGEVAGLKEVWATPDLGAFGTPEMFKKP